MFEIQDHLNAFEELCSSHIVSDKLANAISLLVDHGCYKVASEEKRKDHELNEQKGYAWEELQDSSNKELRKEIRAWLIKQGEDPVEVKETGVRDDDEDEDEDDDEDKELETTEEYDWTSTSTLE
jgi:uncharacterized protein YecT (DUF1311 family)